MKMFSKLIGNYYFRDVITVFSGGLPYEERGKTSSLTIQQGRSTTVLEMDYSIVDFIILCEAPWHTGNNLSLFL